MTAGQHQFASMQLVELQHHEQFIRQQLRQLYGQVEQPGPFAPAWGPAGAHAFHMQQQQQQQFQQPQFTSPPIQPAVQEPVAPIQQPPQPAPQPAPQPVQQPVQQPAPQPVAPQVAQSAATQKVNEPVKVEHPKHAAASKHAPTQPTQSSDDSSRNTAAQAPWVQESVSAKILFHCCLSSLVEEAITRSNSS